MNGNLFVAKTPNDLKRCYEVMKQLRTHLSLEEYLSRYEEAHKADGYEIAAIVSDGQIQAVMGYRILIDFVRGKQVYVDDLVTGEKARSKGFGSELLKYAEKVAIDAGIKHLRLCAVLENVRGIKFYEHNSWSKTAYVFTKKLSEEILF